MIQVSALKAKQILQSIVGKQSRRVLVKFPITKLSCVKTQSIRLNTTILPILEKKKCSQNQICQRFGDLFESDLVPFYTGFKTSRPGIARYPRLL